MNKMYELATLLPLNKGYDSQHGLTQSDVDSVNSMINRIESSRSTNIPKSGDRLIYTSRHGDYATGALISGKEEDDLSICINPYVPFVFPFEDEICCDVSGGPFAGAEIRNLKYIGIANNAFKIWGHCGACANGTVHFNAKVSAWEYIAPEPKYGEFTTKLWRKVYLNKSENSDYLYYGDNLYFKNEDEFQQFLTYYHGTVFPGNWQNQVVVWCFKEDVSCVSRKTWDMIDAPIEQRRFCDKLVDVKVHKDMDSHTVLVFHIKSTI